MQAWHDAFIETHLLLDTIRYAWDMYVDVRRHEPSWHPEKGQPTISAWWDAAGGSYQGLQELL
jgi:hypothetical protein